MRAGPARRWAVLTAALLALVGCAPTPDPSPEPTPSPVGTPGPDTRPLLPVPAVVPAGFTDPPSGQGMGRYTEQTLDWQACGELQCTTVRVPLDYDDPDRTAITLALAKRPASAPARLGSLFMDPGGPGGSGIDLVRSFRPAGLDGYDLIGWDPRGVGASTPVRCFDRADLDRYNAIDVSPDDAAERQALLDENRVFGASCLARSGPLLQHISTAETVRDLDLLRRLVGSTTLDYLGFSYGTKIGALYAQRYPDRVGRMVLDGASDLTGRSVPQILGFERALTSFAAWCAAHSCRLGASKADVLDTTSELLHGLDERPMTVDDRELSQQQAVQAVLYSLYGGVPAWGTLASELVKAQSGDGAPLLARADQANGRSRAGGYDQFGSAFPAIRCLDSQDDSVAGAEREAEEDRQAAPLLAPLSGPDLVCTQWPVAPTSKPGKITAAGAPEVLVVGTTGDPATPYEWAQAMATQLDSAVLLTYVGEGHTAYGSSTCVRARVNDFLVNGVLPPVGTRCTT